MIFTDEKDYLNSMYNPIIDHMIDTYGCIQDQYEDRYEFSSCLISIQESYEQKKYVETDDICIFLSHIKKPLFHLIDSLNKSNDRTGLESLVEQVFDTILTIKGKIESKQDILEEFNVINQLIGDFDIYSDIKTKLSILKEVNAQCKIYDARLPKEIKDLRRTEEEKIEEDDYNFLLD